MRAYLEVVSKLGRRIRISEEYWRMITTVKHQVLAGEEEEVKRVLVEPIEIRRSRTDPDVHMYYARYKGRYLCVVAKHSNGEGFIVTAYPTDQIKRGEVIWRE